MLLVRRQIGKLCYEKVGFLLGFVVQNREKIRLMQIISKVVFVITFLNFTVSAFSKSTDSTRVPSHFSGVITATNNGISLIPAFSLGKPAVLFDLSLGKGRLSFDPMLRFSMEGKPWAFIFWWRYKLIAKKHFALTLGAHPSFVFRTISASNAIPNEYLSVQRYFAWEATPTYILNKKTSFAVNYLGSHGLTKDIIQYTHFAAFRGIFSNLTLGRHLALTVIPQFYYLKLDANQGTYVNATVILSKHNFPISLSSIVSKAIETEIVGKDFIWNIALNYNINNRYLKLH